ncbi:MAG: hypothetical protein RIE86_09275 [Imperialibacter sp.]|uniref:hypothetical protein n=1 Tax=Imperialibacter sp. TaxID=2038411 RepID=UPI0032F06E1A
MKSTTNANREVILLEVLIEKPGQPMELTTGELKTIPSAWMKATEYQKLFIKIEWAPQPGTSTDLVLLTHVKALKRTHKVIDFRQLETLTPIDL